MTGMRKNIFKAPGINIKRDDTLSPEEKFNKVSKELQAAAELGESVPIIELTDTIRKNGFFFRLDKPQDFMKAFEEMLKNCNKTKNKLNDLNAKSSKK